MICLSRWMRCAVCLAILLAAPRCQFEAREGQLDCRLDRDCPDAWICGPDLRCYSAADEFPVPIDAGMDAGAASATNIGSELGAVVNSIESFQSTPQGGDSKK